MPELPFLACDGDNHYYEATDAFTRHVEPKQRRRIVQWASVDGKLRLLVGGKVNRFIPNPTFDPVARPGCLDQYMRGHNPEKQNMAAAFGELEPIHPEYRDRDARLAVMDAQGLEKVFLFPTLGVGMEEALCGDPPACVAGFRAFNRWLDEDWGFAHRGRLFAAPYVTLVEPDAAVEELEWALERDARIVCLRAAPVVAAGQHWSPADPRFDGFWARANEAGITVAFHAGDSGYGMFGEAWGEGGSTESFRSSPLKGLITMGRPAYDVFAALLCHRLFVRFPNLRVASIEMGANWLPLLFQNLRRIFGQAPRAFGGDPVELFKRHVWVSPFQEDDVAGVRDLLGGSERLLMGSDWPHAEGLPEPLDYLGELDGFAPDEIRLVMRENVLALSEPRPA